MGQLGQQGIGNIGQSSVLGTGLAHPNLATSMGGGVMMNTSLGTGMVPPSSYATSSMVNTTFSNPLATNSPSFTHTSFNNPVSNALNQYSLQSTYNPVTTSYNNNVTFSNPLSSQFNSLPLSGPVGMSIKLKPLEEVDLGT